MFLSFSVFFLFFFILRDGNLFDEKDLKNGDEEVQPRVLRKVTAFQRKKRQMMMSKYVAFSLLFFSFDKNTYIPKKKKKTIISSIRPHHRYINRSIER